MQTSSYNNVNLQAYLQIAKQARLYMNRLLPSSTYMNQKIIIIMMMIEKNKILFTNQTCNKL